MYLEEIKPGKLVIRYAKFSEFDNNVEIKSPLPPPYCESWLYIKYKDFSRQS